MHQNREIQNKSQCHLCPFLLLLFYILVTDFLVLALLHRFVTWLLQKSKPSFWPILLRQGSSASNPDLTCLGYLRQMLKYNVNCSETLSFVQPLVLSLKGAKRKGKEVSPKTFNSGFSRTTSLAPSCFSNTPFSNSKTFG